MGEIIELRPATKEEIAECQPIRNLCEGDKLRMIRVGPYRFPKLGQTIIVYGLHMPDKNDHRSYRLLRPDFTSLFVDTSDGEYREYAFDSRFFEKVVESK